MSVVLDRQEEAFTPAPYFSATLVHRLSRENSVQRSTYNRIGRLEKKANQNLVNSEPLASPLPESPSIALVPSESHFDSQKYYELDQLTAKPVLLLEPQLDSNVADDVVASGKVVFALRISNQGEVVEVIVDFSELPEIFVQAASKAFMASKFVPGELNGNKVGALMRIEVVYEDNRLVPN
jgi:hypothetical protein